MPILDLSTLNVPYLYHYQPYKTEWLQEILFNNAIFLSNPCTFNDPWDFRPAFSVTVLDDPETYERHVQWLASLGRRTAPHLAESEHVRRTERLRKDRRFLENIIEMVSNKFASEAFNKYRVYCMSSKFDHTLLWSHYARGHTGICLQFDHYDSVFVRAIKIQYKSEYPAFDLSDNRTEASLTPLHTKSDAWSYEEEFRLIGQEKHTRPPREVLNTREGQLKISPTAIKSVILGCLIDQSSMQEIKTMIRQRIWPPVALKRMVRHPDRYALSMQDVA